MFLNKTIEELKSSNLGGTNIVLENSALIKEYIELKLKHEKEAKEFKADQKLDLDNIYESGIFAVCSKRKADEVYTIVSKIHYDVSIKEQVQTMFDMLIGMFTYVNAKRPYYDNEDKLKIYWATRIKAKRDFKKFKGIQKIEQKRIREKLLDEGFIPRVLNNAYSSIKLSLSNYKELGSDIEKFRKEDAKQFANSLELVLTEIFIKEISK